MSKDGDVKTFRRRREAELKNGRVAMFATMGCGGAQQRSRRWVFVLPFFSITGVGKQHEQLGVRRNNEVFFLTGVARCCKAFFSIIAKAVSVPNNLYKNLRCGTRTLHGPVITPEYFRFPGYLSSRAPRAAPHSGMKECRGCRKKQSQ